MIGLMPCDKSRPHGLRFLSTDVADKIIDPFLFVIRVICGKFFLVFLAVLAALAVKILFLSRADFAEDGGAFCAGDGGEVAGQAGEAEVTEEGEGDRLLGLRGNAVAVGRRD